MDFKPNITLQDWYAKWSFHLITYYNLTIFLSNVESLKKELKGNLFIEDLNVNFVPQLLDLSSVPTMYLPWTYHILDIVFWEIDNLIFMFSSYCLWHSLRIFISLFFHFLLGFSNFRKFRSCCDYSLRYMFFS